MNPRSPDLPEEFVPTDSAAAGAGIVSTLVQAFASDPVATHLFPDPAQRTPGMAHVFNMAVRLAAREGLIEVIQPDRAAAIWMRPANRPSSWRRILASGALATPFVVGWRATRRLLHYEMFVTDFRERRMAGRPHWYLFAIGTRPDARGAGLGSALLKAARRRAAAGGLPCVLETSNQRNLEFYQKNGFSIIGQDRLPGSDLTIWGLSSDRAPDTGPADPKPPHPRAWVSTPPYLPETWSKIGKRFNDRFIYGRGLDARPGVMGGGAKEINTVPRFDSKDAQGRT